MTRSKRLLLQVTPAEKRRILSKLSALGYQQFGTYARAVLPDPFGPFTRSRLLDLLKELHAIDTAFSAGEESAQEKLRALTAHVRNWLD